MSTLREKWWCKQLFQTLLTIGLQNDFVDKMLVVYGVMYRWNSMIRLSQ